MLPLLIVFGSAAGTGLAVFLIARRMEIPKAPHPTLTAALLATMILYALVLVLIKARLPGVSIASLHLVFVPVMAGALQPTWDGVAWLIAQAFLSFMLTSVLHTSIAKWGQSQ